MNSQQILACCAAHLLDELGIKNEVLAELGDREADLILKLISEGENHLELKRHVSGLYYLMPIPNTNWASNNSTNPIWQELCEIWDRYDVIDANAKG